MATVTAAAIALTCGRTVLTPIVTVTRAAHESGIHFGSDQVVAICQSISPLERAKMTSTRLSPYRTRSDEEVGLAAWRVARRTAIQRDRGTILTPAASLLGRRNQSGGSHGTSTRAAGPVRDQACRRYADHAGRETDPLRRRRDRPHDVRVSPHDLGGRRDRPGPATPLYRGR